MVFPLSPAYKMVIPHRWNPTLKKLYYYFLSASPSANGEKKKTENQIKIERAVEAIEMQFLICAVYIWIAKRIDAGSNWKI